MAKVSAKKGKHPGGRPTDYSEKIPLLAEDYLAHYEGLGEVLPSIEGLSEYLGVARSTIYEWAKDEKKKEFSDILEKVLAAQGKKLINSGLLGKFNSTITKVMLTKHGYRDQTETDITSGGEKITGINYIVPQKPDENTDRADI